MQTSQKTIQTFDLHESKQSQKDFKTMKNEQTEETTIPEDEFFGAVNEKSIEDEVMEEDEWLSADDLAEDEIVEAQYADNTVGAFIDLLRRRCKMEDVLLPRLNPDKKEMIVFDLYSKAGRAVIDFVPGRIDDPVAI